VEHAGVSYQILHQTKTECKVLAAVIPAPILADYEGVVRAAGYEPGAVLPSSLATLEAIDQLEAVLIANLSPVALTTTIVNGQDLLLYRTIDLPEEPAQRPTRLHFAGNSRENESGAEEFAHWIDDPEMSVVDLATRPETGAVTSLGAASIAGVAGALAGVR